MKKMNLLMLSVIMMCLASCGPGKTGGGGKDAASIDGVFVDAAVQGLVYSSASHSGVTTADGKYTCKTGETVSFSLPTSGAENLAVGSISCRSVVSPIEIVTNGSQTVSDGLSGLNSTQLAIVKKTLQILQTLDADGDSSNGISIQAAAVDSLVTAFAITDLSVGFGDVVTVSGSIDTVLDVVADSIQPGRTAVTETQATAHFTATISTCSAETCVVPNPTNPVDEDDEEEEEPTVVLGCTNPLAINYNDEATEDDGSCQALPPMPVLGCTDEDATNYNPLATINGGCTYPNPEPTDPVLGCTEEDAPNYNPAATEDDGSCEEVTPPVDEEEEETPVYGCMDDEANNYDPAATHSNGTCTYPPVEEEPVIPGCMEISALNFNVEATVDDGSCQMPPEEEEEPVDP